jgi:nucleoside-diphosphate-sugar epimerase
MKILITGGTGFIGRPLAIYLEERGHDVIALSTQDGDIRDSGLLSKFSEQGIDHVFHLAGRVYIPDAWENPVPFYQINTIGTQHVLEFCRHHGVKLTFISTYLYGNVDTLPISESFPIKAENPYAHSKYLAEQMCDFYSKQFGVTVTIIRPCNIYGIGQGKKFLIPSIIEQAKTAESIRVHDLTPRRDYLHIDDLITAFCSTMDVKEGLNIFNVGSGCSHSVKDVIEVVQKIMNTNKPVDCSNNVRINEIKDVVADTTHIYEVLGWQPKVSFEEGIAQIIQAEY